MPFTLDSNDQPEAVQEAQALGEGSRAAIGALGGAVSNTIEDVKNSHEKQIQLGLALGLVGGKSLAPRAPVDRFAAGKGMLSETLDMFDASKMPRNAWVKVPESGESSQGMYLRKRLGGQGWSSKTLDIANLRFEQKGTGAFSEYLTHLEDEARRRGYAAVRVENIENRDLALFLQFKRGYRVDEMHGDMPTMIKHFPMKFAE